eukprot:gene23153-30358_t
MAAASGMPGQVSKAGGGRSDSLPPGKQIPRPPVTGDQAPLREQVRPPVAYTSPILHLSPELTLATTRLRSQDQIKKNSTANLAPLLWGSREMCKDRKTVGAAALAVSALLNAPPGFLEFLLCVPWKKLTQLYPKSSIDNLISNLHVTDKERKQLVNTRIHSALLPTILDFLCREEHLDSAPPMLGLSSSLRSASRNSQGPFTPAGIKAETGPHTPAGIKAETVTALLDGAPPHTSTPQPHAKIIGGDPILPLLSPPQGPFTPAGIKAETVTALLDGAPPHTLTPQPHAKIIGGDPILPLLSPPQGPFTPAGIKAETVTALLDGAPPHTFTPQPHAKIIGGDPILPLLSPPQGPFTPAGIKAETVTALLDGAPPHTFTPQPHAKIIGGDPILPLLSPPQGPFTPAGIKAETGPYTPAGIKAETVTALLDGATPLHCAALQGNPAQVDHLLHCGADHSLRTAAGELPLEMVPVWEDVVDVPNPVYHCRCMSRHDQELWECRSRVTRGLIARRSLFDLRIGLFTWIKMVVLCLLNCFVQWGCHFDIDRAAVRQHVLKRREQSRQEARSRAQCGCHFDSDRAALLVRREQSRQEARSRAQWGYLFDSDRAALLTRREQSRQEARSRSQAVMKRMRAEAQEGHVHLDPKTLNHIP